MKLIKEIIRQHLSETGISGNFWYLDFNPALIPDSVEYRLYMDVLQKVYPNLRWGGGQPLTGFTRFIPNSTIGCFVIHDFRTYQSMSWSTTSSTYHAKPNTNIDAKEWLSKTQGFNTEDMFGSLYESRKGSNALILNFDPTMNPGSNEYQSYIDVLKFNYPNLEWNNGTPINNFTPFKPIAQLLVGYDYTNRLMWNPNIHTPGGVDGYLWLKNIQGFNTEDMFGSLYESFI